MASFDIKLQNLNFNTTEEKLRDFLIQFGKIENLTMLKNKQSRFSGKAYASFGDDQSLKEALFHSGTEFNGRKVIITKANKISDEIQFEKKPFRQERKQSQSQVKEHIANSKKRTEQYFKINDENSIFVQNIDWNTSELEFGKHFEKYGDIRTAKIQEDPQGRSLGYGYIEFVKHESVNEAIKSDGTILRSRNIRVDKVRRNIEQYNPQSIYVQNIQENTTEMELGKFFEKYGDVRSVKILENKQGESFTSGYVNFNNVESVELALKADGSMLKGNKIIVVRARINRKKQKGPQ